MQIRRLQWVDVFKPIKDTFTYFGIQIQIITNRETDSIERNPSTKTKHYFENEVQNYTNEWTEGRDELETEITIDSKSRQRPSTEHFPTLIPKQLKDNLIDYYLQYQSQNIKNLIN